MDVDPDADAELELDIDFGDSGKATDISSALTSLGIVLLLLRACFYLSDPTSVLSSILAMFDNQQTGRPVPAHV